MVFFERYMCFVVSRIGLLEKKGIFGEKGPIWTKRAYLHLETTMLQEVFLSKK
jgi:hypothetical protein